MSEHPHRWSDPTRDGRGRQRIDDPPTQTAGDHTLIVAAGEDLLRVSDAGDDGRVWWVS